MTARQYYVLSEDQTAYKVGTWVDGEWIPGSLADAYRERALLAREEPEAKVLVEVERP